MQSAQAHAGPMLEEIIVTAQKREQRISDVGMAITAVTGEALAQRGVTGMEDLVKVEPSLQYAKSNNGLPVFTIRGVGYYDQSLAAAPTVSVYLDEQPYAFPALSKGALLDVERVEVLKGPQGILYGQNATGGAINFIAARPTQEFEAGVDASYDRFGAAMAGGFVSGPLGDTLRARLSYRLDEGGAWQQSNTRDDELGDKDFQTARLLLDWAPTASFKASLNLNGFWDRSESQAGQLAGFRFGNPAYITTYPASYFVNNPAAFLPNAADFPSYPAAIQAQVSNPISPADPRAADWIAGTHPSRHEDYFQSTLRLDYDVSDTFGITSLTKFERFRQRNENDLGGINVLTLTALIRGEVDAFAQELRAHGTLDEGKLQWLVGLNYSDDEGNENGFEPSGSSGTYLTGGAVGSVLPIARFEMFGVTHDSETETKSAFANVEYQLSDALSAHAGARYTESTATAASCSYIDSPVLLGFLTGVSSLLTGTPQVTPPNGSCSTFLPNNILGLYETTLDEHNVPWRVGLDWKPVSDTLLYVSASKGFKAGGSPALGAASYVQLKPIVQESVLAYETGFKTALFDRSLQVNGAVFHYDYKNKQLMGRILDPLGLFGALQALVNIPESKEDGAELSVLWRPVTGLTLNMGVTYLDSEVTSDFSNFGPYVTSPTDTINFKGEAFPFTPEWSLSYGARYDWDLNGRLSAYVSANGSYQSETVATFGAQQAAARGPAFDIKAYGLLDLAAGINTAEGDWQFQVWGKNVTDRYYWTNVFYQFDSTLKYAGAPATYGITVNYRY